MADIGYDSFNPILNLGTLFILIAFYVLRLAWFFLVLRPVYYKKRWISDKTYR